MPWSCRIGSRRLAAGWWWTALVLLAMALFISLGRWQWHRAAEKQELTQAFEAGSRRVEPLGSRGFAQLTRYAQVSVSGRYDTDHQFLLDNISRDGRAGYEVLTPLDLPDGRTLLVNRGWVPLRGGGRDVLPDVAFDAGLPLTVSGRFDELPVTGIEAGRVAPPSDAPWPRLTSFPTTAELAASLGRPIQPGQLLLAADQPSGFQRDWKPASAAMGPERHRAYALQWWSFAALAGILFILLNLKRDAT